LAASVAADTSLVEVTLPGGIVQGVSTPNGRYFRFVAHLTHALFFRREWLALQPT
jgi:hypothetical protein